MNRLGVADGGVSRRRPRSDAAAPAAAPDTTSVTHESQAVPTLRMSAMVRFCFAFCRASIKFGIRMAAMIPMMATTIRSSIRVKPRWRFRSF